MVWPTDDSVRARIVANVVTTLEGIKGAGYRTQVRKAAIASPRLAELSVYPAVILAPPRAEYDDRRAGLLMAKLSLSLGLALMAGDDRAGEKILDFIEDVKIALLADVTRGGLAMDTHVLSDEPYVPDTPAPIMAADLTVDVDFRHVRDDVTQEI